MNPYIEKLKSHLAETADPDMGTMIDQLYLYYRETNIIETASIRRRFDHLNDILSKLTLQECDGISDITCALCGEYEEIAFREGVRTGARLVLELDGPM